MATPFPRPGSSGGSTAGRGRGAQLLGILRRREEEERNRLQSLQQQQQQIEDPATLAPALEAASLSDKPEKERRAVVRKGTGGTAIDLQCNYVHLDVATDFGIFEYRTSFKPPVDSANVRFRCLNQHREILGVVKTYDGSVLYLPRRLKEDSVVLKCKPDQESEDMVEVTIEFKWKKNVGDAASLSIFNVAFRRAFKALNLAYLPKGVTKAYFDPNNKSLLEKHHLEIWPGYIVACDEYEGGLLLQCDTSNKVMRTDTCLEVLNGCYKRNPSKYQEDAARQLLGSSAITRYNIKSYKIDEIEWNSTPESSFTDEKGVTRTFAKYYQERYNVQIKDLNQPLLVSLVKRAAGEEPIRVLLVPELCFLCGLTDIQRADFKVMKDVAEFTRLPPAKKQMIVQNLLKSIFENKDALKHLTDWGLVLSEKTLSLEGRILASTSLTFGRGYKEIAKGEWQRACTSNHVFKPVNLEKWVLMFPKNEQQLAKQFCDTLVQQAERVGLRISPPKIEALDQDKIESYLKCIRSTASDAQIVVSLFSGGQRADRYASVKKLLYLEIGKPSQIVLTKTLSNERRLVAIVQKIALQINCKLGGELWGTNIPIPGLMVIGIDVYRVKGVAVAGGGSVAAIVASMNGSFSKYFSKVVFERQGKNFVESLTEQLKEAVVKYCELTMSTPKNIIIFRDGVNSGQLYSAKAEAKTMADAIRGLSPPGAVQPHVSVVIVQKRITTRLYQAISGKVTNPPAGTVVDHTVTLRDYYDFFLIPMAVTQGTVTPVHYVVVHESAEANLAPEVMQRITYALTHSYFNWSGNVKVPAPCQYAHKLVSMVGDHLHKEPNAALESTLYYL